MSRPQIRPGQTARDASASRPAWRRASVIIVLMVSIAALHHPALLEGEDPRRAVFWLFYVPVTLAAVWFGWKGAAAAAALVGLLYLSGLLPGVPAVYPAEPYLQVLVLAGIGVVTGILAGRERKQRQAFTDITEHLHNMRSELEDNFERMKRTERLSAIGQLSAGLAHEIRNPLASIEGAASILQNEPDYEKRRAEFLDIIQKECHRLNRLLTNFLDFARPRPPDYRTVDIAEILDSVIELAVHAVGKSGIRLRQEISTELEPVESDPEQLKQILLNLTINAIQAMPQGGEILLAASSVNGRTVIRVVDQGAGISDEDLERIFDPFFTTKETGTGLGIPVAHQILAQQGGTLTAEKNRDRGMTFSIILPPRRRSAA